MNVAVRFRALDYTHIRFDLFRSAEFHAQLRANKRTIHHFVVFLQLHSQISIV